MAAALIGGVAFEDYSKLINFWLGPFPRPFLRPGLFTSLRDFLVNVGMKVEEKNAIRAIFQSAAKAGSAHVPLAFATVDDFPEEIYKSIVAWMKGQEEEARAGFFRQLFLDLRVTEKEVDAFRNRITQADQKLRPLVKVLKNGGRNLRKGLLTTAQAVQFIGKLPDWSKDKPFF
ncbi:uncharacterized protein LOC118436600 [Folsomia candida]|uniref:uncharacterized protein LOC118436600 n=1 Tax=Folsomia candida TaxID=158441 RepID=UPI0016050824|nr:uncharacterized protein LOC118436600 [Folsomia candida]